MNTLSLALPDGGELTVVPYQDESGDWTIRVEATGVDGLGALSRPSRLWLTQIGLFYALRATATPLVFEYGDAWREFSVASHSVPTALRTLSGILEVTPEQATSLEKVNALR